MNCKSLGGEKLSAYIDGMLTGDELRKVSAHIDECAACRATYEDLQKVRQMLRGMSTPSVPSRETFWADAYRRARVAAPRRAPGSAGLSRGGQIGRIIAAAGFAVVVVAALVTSTISGNPGLDKPRSVPPAAVVDISDLVQAHADSVAAQPLSDRARVTMVTSEVASQESTTGSTADGNDSFATDPAVNAATGMD